MGFLHPDLAGPVLQEAAAKEKFRSRIQASVTPQISQTIAGVYRRGQFLPPTVVLPLAKSNASLDAVDAANQTSSSLAMQEQKPDPENWFQRNVFGSIKKASRYTFAALGSSDDIAQNVIASVVNSQNRPQGLGGIFQSTELGTLLADGDKQGSGYFAGEELQKLQGERARAFRGTIDDAGEHAFTAGRFAAGLVLPDKSFAYNLVSGLVDGAVSWYSDPTLYAGKAIKQARIAKNVIPDTGVALKEIEALRVAGKAAEADYAEKALAKIADVGKEITRLRRVTAKLTNSIRDTEELVKTLKGSGRPTAILEERIAKQTEELRGFRDKIDELSSTRPARPTAEEARAAAGNISEQTQTWDNTKFSEWWGQNRGARRMEQSIQGFVDGFSAAKKGKTAEEVGTLRHFYANEIRAKAFNGTITHEDALRLVDNGEGDKVKYVIAEAASRLKGEETEMIGQFPTDIRKLPGAQASTQFKNATIYRVPRVVAYANRFIGKAAAKQMIVKGDPTSRYKAVENVRRLLDSVRSKIDDTTYQNIMGRVAGAYSEIGGGRSAVYDVQKEIQLVVREVLQKGHNVPESAINKMMAEYEQQVVKLRARIATELGEDTGHDLVRGLIDSGMLDVTEDEIIRRLGAQGSGITSISQLSAKVISPTISAELMDTVQFLPDPRKLRRLSKDPFFQRTLAKATGGKVRVGKLLTTKEGDARAIVDMAEWLQNDLWKPLTLLNPGYLVRNLMDGQFHVALSGDRNLSGMFNNPLAFFSWVMGNRGVEDITGLNFKQQEGWFDAVARNTSRWTGDPTNAAEKVITTGDYVNVVRIQNAEAHTYGILDQLRMLFKSPEVRQGFVQFSKDGTYSVQETLRYLERNPRLRRDLLAIAKDGPRYGLDNGRATVLKTRKGLNDDELLTEWLTTEVGGRIEKWKNTPELSVMAMHNRVPVIEPGAQRAFIDDIQPDVDTIDGKAFSDRVISMEGEPGVGSIISGPANEGFDYIVVSVGKAQRMIRTDGTRAEREVWNVMRIHKERTAWVPSGGNEMVRGKPYDNEAIDVINKLYNSVDNQANQLIPAETGYMVRQNMADKDTMGRVMSKWKDITNVFFGSIVGSTMEKLEKSPIYRQYYYKYVTENADLLSQKEFQTMVQSIRDGAQRLGITESAYIGGNPRGKEFARLLAKEGKATGVGTVQQLDKYAQIISLKSMKDLLFDAAEKTNLEDSMRILAPFGAAWREVITKYVKQIADDPTNIRKVERVFTGATKVDLENDGTGFFYKDPQTGQYNFNYPMSDKLSRVFTGLTAPLAAPIKGLSVGLTYMPALGPVGQIAANTILPFVPKENEFRRVFLPYGTPGSGLTDFAPGYLRKTLDALRADPEKMQTQYGQTYVETVRALYATGDYNTADPIQREKLLNDAKGKAKILSIFRAVNQFFGPAAGTVKFEVKSDEGDVYMSQLVKQFQDLQAKSYDTAVPEFLEQFGDDMMLYISGKSRSEIGGLTPTAAFEEWANNNKDLMAQYKGVAGFLAEGESDFSFAVWKKQIDRGDRSRLTAREVLDQSELMVGSAKFRAARLKFGAYPTANQRTWLRSYRAALHAELPGFPEIASFDPAEFPTFVENLKQLIADPKVANNDVAIASQIYLKKRDEVLAQAGQAGYLTIKSRAMSPLRDYLASIGDALIAKYPEFKRIFEQKLQAELMQYEQN
jgi:hypothetical protein